MSAQIGTPIEAFQPEAHDARSDLFAAGMVASGGMYAATTDPFYGSYVGPYGSNRDPNVAGREAWQCSGSMHPRIVPVLVFQGSDDAIVIPLNGQQTIEQFAQMNDLGDDGLDNNTIVAVPALTYQASSSAQISAPGR